MELSSPGASSSTSCAKVVAVPATDDGKTKCIFDASPLMVHREGVQGNLHLDQIGEYSYMLSNSITNERSHLPAGYWEIIFDDSGTCASLLFMPPDDIDAEFTVLDTRRYIHKELFVSDAGERYIVWHAEDGTTSNVYSLDHALTKHAEAKLSVRIGSTNAFSRIDGATMQLQRAGGAWVYWSMRDVYGLLGLSSYKHQPSKWVSESHKSWTRNCVETLGFDCLIFSKHANLSEKRADELEWYSRCLSTTCISTSGLAFLACRWCALTKGSGGLEDQQCKESAQFLLQAMCTEAVAYKSGLQFQLSLDTMWVSKWPRPGHNLVGTPTIDMCIDASGNLNLEPLVLAASDSRVVRLWWKGLSAHGLQSGATGVHVVTLLKICAKTKALSALFAQVLLAMTGQLELSLAAQGKATSQSAPGSVCFRFCTPEETHCGAAMDYKLAQYVCAGVEVGRKHKFSPSALTKLRQP
jgi:hypothetical protein